MIFWNLGLLQWRHWLQAKLLSWKACLWHHTPWAQTSLDTWNACSPPLHSASGLWSSSSEMQTLRSHPELLNQSLRYHKASRWLTCTLKVRTTPVTSHLSRPRRNPPFPLSASLKSSFWCPIWFGPYYALLKPKLPNELMPEDSWNVLSFPR